jgi:hypothetical protein
LTKRENKAKPIKPCEHVSFIVTNQQPPSNPCLQAPSTFDSLPKHTDVVARKEGEKRRSKDGKADMEIGDHVQEVDSLPYQTYASVLANPPPLLSSKAGTKRTKHGLSMRQCALQSFQHPSSPSSNQRGKKPVSKAHGVAHRGTGREAARRKTTTARRGAANQRATAPRGKASPGGKRRDDDTGRDGSPPSSSSLPPPSQRSGTRKST